MNANGNDKIDQQLKAAAAKRREAQGAEFRPSDFQKEELLREVRSRWPVAPPAEKRGWWVLFAPRLAFAASLGAFALLVAGVLMRQPVEPVSDEQALTLGREFKILEDRRARDEAPKAADALKAEQEGVLLQKQAASAPPQPEGELPRLSYKSAGDAPPAPAQQLESRTATGSASDAGSAGPRLRAAPPEPAARPDERTLSVAPSPARRVATSPAPRSLGLEARDQAQTSPGGENQWFFRQRTTNSRPLLQFFSVQQSGDQMSLRDSDGSVYLGTLSARPSGGVGGGAMTTNVVDFSVEGTNDTLRQKVMIRGAIVAAAPSRSTVRYALAPTNVQHVLRGIVQRQNQEPFVIEALSESPPPPSVPTRP